MCDKLALTFYDRHTTETEVCCTACLVSDVSIEM